MKRRRGKRIEERPRKVLTTTITMRMAITALPAARITKRINPMLSGTRRATLVVR